MHLLNPLREHYIYQTFPVSVDYQSNANWDPNDCSKHEGYSYSPAALRNCVCVCTYVKGGG